MNPDDNLPTLPGFAKAHRNGTMLSVKVQPRTSRNEIGEPTGDELKIRVTAPPVDAAANEAVLRLLAKALGCPRGSVQIVKGATARHKRILVAGITPGDVFDFLQKSRV